MTKGAILQTSNLIQIKLTDSNWLFQAKEALHYEKH